MDPSSQCSVGCFSSLRPVCSPKNVGQDFLAPLPSQHFSRVPSAESALLLGKDVVGCEPDVDELLANAGYNVKTSDLAQVAERLEQLESFLCAAQEAGISHLSQEAVHYNPSDLAGWVECMIGELAPNVGVEPQKRQRVGEYAYGGDFGSNSLDTQLDRASYVRDGSTQPASGSVSSLGAASQCKERTSQRAAVIGRVPRNGCTQPASGSVSSLGAASQFEEPIAQGAPVSGWVPRYKGVENISEVALLEELEELQYRTGCEDQASSNFYAGLPAPVPRSVFPEGLDAAHIPAKPPPSGGLLKPYPQQGHQVHRERPQQKPPDGAVRISPSPLSASGLPSLHAQSIKPPEQHQQPADQTSQSSLSVVTNGLYAQQPMIDEDAQESGIRLVHLLMACAEAVQNNELTAAHGMVREISRLASPQCGAMGKVATHFVEALARRIYSLESQDDLGVQVEEVLYFQFYESCPYLKFAHFTANQAILEAFEGHKLVHVIDFNLMQGLQWPALIQALALRAGGPPRFRLTGIGPPQPDDKDVLQEVGMKLAQLAESVNVEFEFRGVVATKLDDVKPWMLEVRAGEAVAINSILQLHRLLITYGENSHLVTPIDEVLESMRSLNPRIITVVEQEANHNSPYFLDRFLQALHYYSTMFDSLEACAFSPQSSEVLLTEIYLGREIVNIVACEGVSRLERHETIFQWRARMAGAGFKPLLLGSNAFKQASMLLNLFSGEGYTVEENSGCLTLGWHSRPLIAASAWQCG